MANKNVRKESMTKKEFDQRMEELKDQFQKAKTKIKIIYAMSNNPYKVGDIIQDKFLNIIKIEQIQAIKTAFALYPECLYTGPRLKKNLTLMKKQTDNTIYQSNVRRKLN